MTVAIILLGFGIVLWLYFLWSRRRFYWFSLKVPGPVGLPFLGIALRLRSLSDLLPELLSIAETYNCTTGFSYAGIVPFLVTKDPIVAEKILTSPDCVDKPYIYDVFVESLGAGLLTTDPPKSNVHRKMINPAFNHNILVSFFPIFNEGTDDFLKELDGMVDCGAIDISSSIYRCTLRISIETTMGMNGKEYRERSEQLLPYAETVLMTTMNRLMKPWLRVDAIFRLSSMYKPYKEAKKFVDQFVNEVISIKLDAAIKNKRNNLPSENNNKDDDFDDDVGIKKSKNIFIDQVIDLYLKKHFDWNDFFGESSAMIYAVFETSGTTLVSIFMMLAMHPQYQEKLYEEVVSVFPEKDFEVNYDDLQKLVYMDMIINETFRVAATIPLIARHASADIHVNDNLIIPKGTQLIVDIFDMHRCPKIWGPNSKKFNPDHFLPDNFNDKHPYAFTPFSKGPRNCIGWRYATMLLKVVIAKAVRNYQFTTKFPFEDLQFSVNLTLKFKETPQIEVHRR